MSNEEVLSLMTANEEILALMIATEREPCSDTWFFHEKHGEPSMTISALTGVVDCSRNDSLWAEQYLKSLPLKKSIEDCLPEAKQRIADFKANAGDADECLCLINRRAIEQYHKDNPPSRRWTTSQMSKEITSDEPFTKDVLLKTMERLTRKDKSNEYGFVINELWHNLPMKGADHEPIKKFLAELEAEGVVKSQPRPDYHPDDIFYSLVNKPTVVDKPTVTDGPTETTFRGWFVYVVDQIASYFRQPFKTIMFLCGVIIFLLIVRSVLKLSGTD